MRINKKKPKGKYQVKKFPHGGTHSEGELPEEGTMMGDLLRMLEGYRCHLTKQHMVVIWCQIQM